MKLLIVGLILTMSFMTYAQRQESPRFYTKSLVGLCYENSFPEEVKAAKDNLQKTASELCFPEHGKRVTDFTSRAISGCVIEIEAGFVCQVSSDCPRNWHGC